VDDLLSQLQSFEGITRRLQGRLGSFPSLDPIHLATATARCFDHGQIPAHRSPGFAPVVEGLQVLPGELATFACGHISEGTEAGTPTTAKPTRNDGASTQPFR